MNVKEEIKLGITIWIEKKDKYKVVNKIMDESEEEPTFEGLDINEFYIDKSDGSLDGYIQVEEIGLGINIPFKDWFVQFLKFNSFDNLDEYLSKHKEDIEKTYKKLEEMRKKLKPSK